MVNVQTPLQSFRQESFPAITQASTDVMTALYSTNITSCNSVKITFTVSTNAVLLGVTMSPQTDETTAIYQPSATAYQITFPTYSEYTDMALRLQSAVGGAHGTVALTSVVKRGARYF